MQLIPLLDVDLESRSSVDLTKTGVYPYSRHPDTGVWRMSYRFKRDGEYTATKRWVEGQPPPAEVAAHIRAGYPVWGHNVEFEREMWEQIMAPRHGFPEVAVEQWECTMARGLAAGRPASLDHLGASVGIDNRKDTGAGYSNMMLLAKPVGYDALGKPIFLTPDQAPDKHEKLGDYCDIDVIGQGETRELLYKLSDFEHDVYVADAHINRAGIGIDRPAVAAALQLLALETDRLNDRLSLVTGGVVTKLTQRDRLKKWLAEQGVELENLAKATVKGALERVFDLPELDAEDIDDDYDLDSAKVYQITGVAREALEIRREGAKASTSKLIPMLLQCCPDGRARGLFIYSKAHTRRWASKGIQLQNFPRGVLHLAPHEVAHVMRILKESRTPGEAAALLRLTYGEPLTVLSDCMRGFLIAAPGHEFVATDSAQVEARMLAWLCGDQETLDTFERGDDIYSFEATRLYGRKITKADIDERQAGKVGSLAFQFGGGVGAGHQMGKTYAMYKTDAEWEALRDLYRATHPHQVSFWEKLETAARSAILNPGTAYYARAEGFPDRACKFAMVEQDLICKLPSGGTIVYPEAQVKLLPTPWGKLKDTVTYMGVHPKIKKWVRLKTHGGKLSENVTQSCSRDILAWNILRFRERGWSVVAHAHDEILCEMPIGALKLAEANRVLATPPPWGVGLPLGATGWTGPRYRKE